METRRHRRLAPDVDDDALTARSIHNVFTAGDDGLRALRWLAITSGFHATLPAGSSIEVHIDHNARRSMFGVVYEILNATHEGREALSVAFRPGETTKEPQ